ncbi:Uu.00g051180.m01.CDS01 [Anthostomella pinea]|uniref:Uu.00g051180.m01.CDS01 n=1 Tax=Anthostomella pinea TaxID=933095 RepID=A0AAI8YMU4_9PEZI|nr:Uu.00g051180.m01.CDS01 [Anthostomella pinea]
MPPTRTPHEPSVYLGTRMPGRYIQVPKGNAYLTSHCRARTHAAGQTVYAVHNAKRRPVGIRVPRAVYESVLADHNATASTRAAATQRRDDKLRAEFETAIRAAVPRVPEEEVGKVLDWTTKKGARRVGRVGKLGVGEKAVLAVRAYVRHEHTAYEQLLRDGVERDGARRQTFGAIDAVCKAWGWDGKKRAREVSRQRVDGEGGGTGRKRARSVVKPKAASGKKQGKVVVMEDEEEEAHALCMGVMNMRAYASKSNAADPPFSSSRPHHTSTSPIYIADDSGDQDDGDDLFGPESPGYSSASSFMDMSEDEDDGVDMVM